MKTRLKSFWKQARKCQRQVTHCQFYTCRKKVEKVNKCKLCKINNIFENNLNLVEDFLNSEHYLVEHNDIAYCFSIGSTSSLSAYKMGFNSKVSYRSIFQDDEIIKGFDSIFEDTDESIHTNNDFSDIRKETVEEKISKKDFNHLFDVLRENYEMSNMS